MYSESGTTYRFGFNGMMRDDDAKDVVSTYPLPVEGVGNSYDFGARMYDPRVGRFFSLDPMKTKFPWQSPYLFADNNPANKIDVEGKWAGFVHHYILDAAMDGIDPQLVAKLKLGSDYADSEKYQSSQYNNNHAMMDIGQTMDAYKEGVNGFLNRKMDLFVTSGNISELSMGLHCVMDMTCPSHLGQVWNGWTLTNPFKNLDEAAIHTFWDFNLFGISNNEVEQAEKNVQTYYDKAVNKRNEYILNHPELENKELFIDDLEDRKKEDALEKENKEKKSTNSNGNNKPD
ncbi:MAG: RHS repeat-associated core domain-containing protein [Candidatus Kapabacteria bacterium]|jgi:RHS repeat-associated protein|nr:RHS repeat-associated core domain-containing protein [Candidatus Kapabacteria bacterium]